MKTLDIINGILEANETEKQGTCMWGEDDGTCDEWIKYMFGTHCSLDKGEICRNCMYLYYYENELCDGSVKADAEIWTPDITIYLYKIE